MSRNEEPIYSCTLFDFGPGGNIPCTNPLKMKDQPGDGTWTYQVQSVRLGAGGREAAVVGSTSVPAAPPVAVADSSRSKSATSGSEPELPPVPVVGAFAGLYPGNSSGQAPGAALPGDGSNGPAGGPVENLTYPSSDDPVLGVQGSPARESGPSGPDVVPLGMVAAALLILAVAAHLLFLRGLADARRLRNGKVG